MDQTFFLSNDYCPSNIISNSRSIRNNMIELRCSILSKSSSRIVIATKNSPKIITINHQSISSCLPGILLFCREHNIGLRSMYLRMRDIRPKTTKNTLNIGLKDFQNFESLFQRPNEHITSMTSGRNSKHFPASIDFN